MTTISVASGKGGAGKTSIAAALASTLGADCVFADCDVDAANGAIALGARIDSREPYFAGPGYIIQPCACTGCGRCHAACRFSAIEPVPGSREFRIIQELCERCGACVDTCPTGAIAAFRKQAGELYISTSRTGTELVHAELEPGEDTSGKLVATASCHPSLVIASRRRTCLPGAASRSSSAHRYKSPRLSSDCSSKENCGQASIFVITDTLDM